MTNAALKSLLSTAAFVMFSRLSPKVLQGFADGFHHIGIFIVGQVDFTGIHAERAAIVGTVDIFWCKMEVEMRQLVAVGAIVDFLRVKHLVHRAGHAGYVIHKCVALLRCQFEKIIDMTVVGYETTPTVGLLFKKEHS